MKTCSKCKIDKDNSEFSKDKSRGDGLNLYCRKCISSIAKEYRLNNRDVLIQKSREFKLKNPQNIKENNKNYRIRHSKKIIDRNKEYRLKNRELINKRNKNYRLNNHDSYKESVKKYIDTNPEKIRDANKKYILKLTDKYVKKLIVRDISDILVTEDLIEWKRISVRIKRLIKEKKQCETSAN